MSTMYIYIQEMMEVVIITETIIKRLVGFSSNTQTTHTQTHTQTHKHTHSHTHTHTHTIHTYTHTSTRTRMHALAHTHTHVPAAPVHVRKSTSRDANHSFIHSFIRFLACTSRA
eukprot:GHVU01033459.1.p3 GENE.GHVU01033459.1~~GHVU01033459.1.p3  ORF type:complete len:114 (-),score=12.15 GHVU01033459.1:238-579(-)